jgi:hypothetical protein
MEYPYEYYNVYLRYKIVVVVVLKYYSLFSL